MNKKYGILKLEIIMNETITMFLKYGNEVCKKAGRLSLGDVTINSVIALSGGASEGL